MGDGLLAHELAHVAQQGGADGETTTAEDEASTVERDADAVAVHAVRSLWSSSPEASAQLEAANLTEAAPPRARTHFGIRSCKRAPTPPPTEVHNLPADTAPLSSPGEQILFSALYGTNRPDDFQMLYVAQGGATLDAPAGPTSKTIDGTAFQHHPMYIPTDWNGAPITVEFKIRRKSDGAIVATKTWRFGKKAFIPTNVLEFEHGPQPLSAAAPTTFAYQMEPRPPAGWTGNPSGPYYEHNTILERFEGHNCNVRPEELKPEVTRDHPEFTTSNAIANFFFALESFNATFTVDHSDAIVDQHSAGVFITQGASLMRSITTPKAIEWDLTQVYEAAPGAVLARYVIRRRLNTNGTTTVEKVRR